MIKFLKYFFTLLAVITIVSCDSDKENTTTYFGGKIINPKSDFVLLYHQNQLIDSLVLDKEDKFLGEYDNFKEGFYYFQHGPEHQYVYIQPQDSILIRLNTWDFDESLVFSGSSGAEKNNILIDYFLESEKENRSHDLYSFYALTPNAFKIKLDSLLEIRQRKIDTYVSNNENLPSDYLLILDVVAKYPLYKRFEKYPAYNKRINKTYKFPKTDSLFYSYRENININNKSLMYLGVYSRYVINRLYNNVYSKGHTSKSKDFTVTLLNTIDKNIHDEKLKNTFLKEMVINDFLDKSSCAVDKDVFYAYFKLSSDIEDKKQVQRLLNDVKNLHGGTVLPDFDVFDFNDTKKSIKEISKNKNTVIYIWNPRFVGETYLASRINYLSRKFPKLNFIGVKVKEFKNNTPIAGIDIKKQFYINKNSEANSFLTSKLPRTILINKKGMVINGYATISRSRVLKQLKYLQKQ